MLRARATEIGFPEGADHARTVKASINSASSETAKNASTRKNSAGEAVALSSTVIEKAKKAARILLIPGLTLLIPATAANAQTDCPSGTHPTGNTTPLGTPICAIDAAPQPTSPPATDPPTATTSAPVHTSPPATNPPGGNPPPGTSPNAPRPTGTVRPAPTSSTIPDSDRDGFRDDWDFDPNSPGIGDAAKPYAEVLRYDLNDPTTLWAIISTAARDWESYGLARLPEETVAPPSAAPEAIPVITDPAPVEPAPPSSLDVVPVPPATDALPASSTEVASTDAPDEVDTSASSSSSTAAPTTERVEPTDAPTSAVAVAVTSGSTTPPAPPHEARGGTVDVGTSFSWAELVKYSPWGLAPTALLVLIGAVRRRNNRSHEAADNVYDHPTGRGTGKTGTPGLATRVDTTRDF